MRLVFVTGNPGKLREARHALKGIAHIEQDRDGYLEPQADTLEAVARHGLAEVGARRQPPYFLEDAGLFIDALEGFPGVYSAYVYKTLGLNGILRLLHERIEPHERTAHFEAVLAYRDAEGDDHLFHGTAKGHIAAAPRGQHGFGYDPIFVPEAGNGRTFAELGPREKEQISHRGAALQRFIGHLGG